MYDPAGHSAQVRAVVLVWGERYAPGGHCRQALSVRGFPLKHRVQVPEPGKEEAVAGQVAQPGTVMVARMASCLSPAGGVGWERASERVREDTSVIHDRKSRRSHRMRII